MPLPSESRTDLTWLAFRYVAGEISGEEAEAFERRLAQEQPAREAVAEAVLLAGAVAALPPEAPAVLPIDRRRSLRPRVIAAAAACLVIAVGLSIRGAKPPARFVAPAQIAFDPTGNVALAWSGLRQEFDPAKGGPDDPSAWLDEPEPPALEAESVADLGLPSWLIEAAAIGDRATAPKEN